jgi:hypothetical protein
MVYRSLPRIERRPRAFVRQYPGAAGDWMLGKSPRRVLDRLPRCRNSEVRTPRRAGRRAVPLAEHPSRCRRSLPIHAWAREAHTLALRREDPIWCARVPAASTAVSGRRYVQGLVPSRAPCLEDARPSQSGASSRGVPWTTACAGTLGARGSRHVNRKRASIGPDFSC